MDLPGTALYIFAAWVVLGLTVGMIYGHIVKNCDDSDD